MRSFVRAADELHHALGKVLFFPGLLNAFIILLAVMLVLSVIDFHPWLAVLPFIYYLIFRLPRRGKVNRVRMVEKEYPELDEKLRTAVDYANQDGIVIDELHQEVAADLQNVHTAVFFPRSQSAAKVSLCVLLCVAILVFASLNLPIDEFKKNLKDKAEDVINTLNAGSSTNFITKSAGAGKGNPDIYGEKSLTQLGNKQLEVQIKPAAFDLALRNARDAEDKPFESGKDFPSDLGLTSGSTYEENIPKEQQEIVKKYFKNLNQQESG